jgi:hypothetical protein
MHKRHRCIKVWNNSTEPWYSRAILTFSASFSFLVSSVAFLPFLMFFLYKSLLPFRRCSSISIYFRVSHQTLLLQNRLHRGKCMRRGAGINNVSYTVQLRKKILSRISRHPIIKVTKLSWPVYSFSVCYLSLYRHWIRSVNYKYLLIHFVFLQDSIFTLVWRGSEPCVHSKDFKNSIKRFFGDRSQTA